MPIWIWYRKKETAREYSCITPVIHNLKQLVFFFWEHLDSPQNIQLRILKQLAKWTTIERFIHLHSERTHTPSVSDDNSLLGSPYYRCRIVDVLANNKHIPPFSRTIERWKVTKIIQKYIIRQGCIRLACTKHVSMGFDRKTRPSIASDVLSSGKYINNTDAARCHCSQMYHGKKRYYLFSLGSLTFIKFYIGDLQ